MKMLNGWKMKAKPSIIFAIASWSIGIFGIIVFSYAMTSTARFAGQLFILSPLVSCIFFLGNILSLISGIIEMKRGRENAFPSKASIQTPAAMILSCLGLTISVCMLSIFGYYMYLYSIWHY